MFLLLAINIYEYIGSGSDWAGTPKFDGVGNVNKFLNLKFEIFGFFI